MAEMHLESKMLDHGFTGRVEDAQASVASDKESIMTEIGDNGDEVDECLEVLLAAGMSNKLLQDAYQHGVAVHGIGFTCPSTLYLGFAMWCWIVFYISGDLTIQAEELWQTSQWRQRYISVVPWSWSVAVSWALVYLFVDGHVRRVFARRCMIRLVPVCSALLFVPVVIASHFDTGDVFYNMMLVVDGLGFIAVLSSVLNLDGLLRIPCVGPWFASLMLGCACNCAGRHHGLATEESSDSSRRLLS